MQPLISGYAVPVLEEQTMWAGPHNPSRTVCSLCSLCTNVAVHTHHILIPGLDTRPLTD